MKKLTLLFATLILSFAAHAQTGSSLVKALETAGVVSKVAEMEAIRALAASRLTAVEISSLSQSQIIEKLASDNAIASQLNKLVSDLNAGRSFDTASKSFSESALLLVRPASSEVSKADIQTVGRLLRKLENESTDAAVVSAARDAIVTIQAKNGIQVLGSTSAKCFSELKDPATLVNAAVIVGSMKNAKTYEEACTLGAAATATSLGLTEKTAQITRIQQLSGLKGSQCTMLNAQIGRACK